MFNTLKHCVTISYCSTFIAMNSEKFSLKWNDFEANISKGCLQKKKLHMEGKVPFWGEGVRKKGQISLVKEQKK